MQCAQCRNPVNPGANICPYCHQSPYAIQALGKKDLGVGLLIAGLFTLIFNTPWAIVLIVLGLFLLLF